MIDNDFILVSREMVQDLTSYDDGVRLKAEQKARALLAKPVDSSALPVEVERYTENCGEGGGVTPHRDGEFCDYHHVTRLQAEVELWKGRATNICRARAELQSELTKARELLTADYQLLGLNNSLVSYREQMKAIATYLSNQSAPADKEGQGEPVAWANDQQLLLCSKSPRENCPGNSMMHNLPRNIAGSALRTEYCNTPLYAEQPAPVAVVLPDFEPAFEAWWESDGQYCRSGGGDYEKTFAYRAYEAALAEIASLNPIKQESTKEAFDKGAALESLAKQIYESWQSQPGYLPWVNGGNSLKQDEARRIASRTFELALANQVEE